MRESDDGTSAFALPDRLAEKSAPALIGDDEQMFARIRDALAGAVDDTAARLARVRLEPGRAGQAALERDREVQRLSAWLRVLRRFGLDACIGRMAGMDGELVYVGRFGLSDATGARLLVDWRAPAAEPFFAASHGHPLGLASCRRYRWSRGRIVDYWDEMFAADGIDHGAALDDQSAFIASLGASRSPRMRDVLATIQADQDAIVRAGSSGALVVEGGPGTGKTVVALHRAAYLLYGDPRLREGGGGLLFVGPHRPYLDYIDDVLPSLGEEGALVATLSDLVTGGGADVPVESDLDLRRVKSDARMASAIDAATALWEHPPVAARAVPTPWGPVQVSAAEWAEVFEASGDLPHNAVHSDAWERLVDLVADRVDETLRRLTPGAGDAADGGTDERWSEGWGEATPVEADDGFGDDPLEAEGQFDAYGLDDHAGATRAVLDADDDLRSAFARIWPLLDPEALLRGLWASADMLATCAPWLTGADVAVLTRAAGADWTDVDLPSLDAARLRVGDPADEVRRRRARAEAAADRAVMDDVVTHLIAADDGDLRVMSMLRGQDLRQTLDTFAEAPADPFAGPFAHIVVDEAQELTDAQWQMLLRRCPSGSFTIVGDRAQARHGFTETWEERVGRVGVGRVTVSTLTIGYRTPEEVMAVAEPVIRAALPDASVPCAIRHSGLPVRHGPVVDLERIITEWADTHAEGVAVVIGAPWFPPRDRVRSLDPERVKGLEFDLVVLVDPEGFGDGLTGAVDRYVAMTRATAQLVLLTS
ncbi:HelD family protein [Microbacterium lacticum]